MSEQPQKTWRAFPVNGEALRRLRAAKGWETLSLANRAGCSEKTVSNLERGGRAAFPHTIRRLAMALGVEPQAIIADAFTPPEPGVQLLKGKTVEIKLVLNIDDVSAVTPLLQQLIELAEAQGQIEVKKMEKGSVIVTLEMDVADVYRILQAIARGDLNDFPLERIILPNDRDFTLYMRTYSGPKAIQQHQLDWEAKRREDEQP